MREELNNVYEEWKSSEFNPNFRFKLDDGYEVETTLLHIAIQCRKSAACPPLVQCLLDQGADPNVQDSPHSSFTLTCVLMPFLNHPCPIHSCTNIHFEDSKWCHSSLESRNFAYN
ncbi:MAG: ankyrin repeat domain-containing protein [Wolbachia sp.]